jgi:hypothetical protein
MRSNQPLTFLRPETTYLVILSFIKNQEIKRLRAHGSRDLYDVRNPTFIILYFRPRTNMMKSIRFGAVEPLCIMQPPESRAVLLQRLSR